MNGKMPNPEASIHTQIHHARCAVVTEQMKHVARREGLSPTLVRDEVGRGRMVIPANVNHRNLEPMCIGIAGSCKINANIGDSATTSDIEEELKKLRYCIKYGADTVMDLSTGGDIPLIRRAIIDESPVPIGTRIQGRGFLLHVRSKVLLDEHACENQGIQPRRGRGHLESQPVGGNSRCDAVMWRFRATGHKHPCLVARKGWCPLQTRRYKSLDSLRKTA